MSGDAVRRQASPCNAVVVLNGCFSHVERLLEVVRGAHLVVAADGGGDWLYAQGYTPHILVGDLDSISSATLQALETAGCEVLRYRPDKDETDAELALLAARARGATQITILGATGGRIDHELGNVQLLAMPQLCGIHVVIYDGISWLWLGEGRTEIRGAVGDVVSLIPWGGDVHGLVTIGLRYPLRDETLVLGPARGVSNVLTQPVAHVTWTRGRLLIVHTPCAHLED